MEDGEFQKADNYFDRVIDADPENGEAYFGKLLAERKIKKRENLSESTYQIDKSPNYQKAYKFGDKNLRGELITASKLNKQRIEEKYKDEKYNEGCKLLASSKIEDIEKATEIFKQIPDWKNSGQKIAECQEKIKELKTKANNIQYNKGIKLMQSSVIEDIEFAIRIFEQIPDWNDSGQKITECQELIQKLRTEANNIQYNKGIELMQSSVIEDIEFAIRIFEQIPDWNDSGQKITECRAKIQELEEKAEQERAEKARQAARKRKRLIGIICASMALLVAIIAVIIIVPPAIDRNLRNGLFLELSTDGSYYIVTGIEDKNRSEIIIPDTYKDLPVKEIGNSAFYDCDRLTSVTIGDNVCEIGNYAFSNCYGLTIITIPDSVSSIGDCAFYRCIGLKSVIIGKHVNSIGYFAFYSCSELTSVTFRNTIGWRISRNSNMTSGEDITVTDPAKNAENFRNIYSEYYWARR